jgi:carbon-monoxide dehydrogenase small subunit
MKTHIELNVNGRTVHVQVAPEELLLDVLRNQLGLLGAKEGCSTGECGACTVLMDGRPVNACLILAVRAQGVEITTIEGLGTPDNLHPLQEAFVDHAALQCGFCGPGVLLSAKALLDRNPTPTEQEIKEAIAGNVCRCTGYTKMIEAIQRAAEALLREGETE